MLDTESHYTFFDAATGQRKMLYHWRGEWWLFRFVGNGNYVHERRATRRDLQLIDEGKPYDRPRKPR